MPFAKQSGSRLLFATAVVVSLAPGAFAQFGTPGVTTVREKIVGQLVSATGAPAPEAGDQIGAFFGTGSTNLCGKFTFVSTSGSVTRDVSIVMNGDVAGTSAKEGPAVGEKVTFKFYDSSTNTTLPLTVITTTGETFNYTFNGQTVIDLPGGIPIDLTPSRDLSFRLGGSDSGNGGGGTGNTNKYDINGDGKVTIEDSAAILAVVSGGRPAAPSVTGTLSTNSTASTTSSSSSTSTASTAAAATTSAMDVNGDSKVDVNDAIEVLRHKDGR